MVLVCYNEVLKPDLCLDKGMGKGLTYLLKMILLKTAMLLNPV